MSTHDDEPADLVPIEVLVSNTDVFWADKDGAMHIDLAALARSLGLPHTKETEDRLAQLAREVLARELPGAKIIETKSARLPPLRI